MLSPELLSQIRHIYIRGRHLASEVFTGEYESAFKGRGIEFEEVREYVPGDEVRFIDWNVSARMGKPYLKVFKEEREQTLILLVDVSKSNLFGTSQKLKNEAISELASILAFAAIQSNDKVGLVLFSDEVEKFIPPKKGRSHVWHILSEILSFKPKNKGTNINKALLFADRVMTRSSIFIMISDFLGDYDTKVLRRCAGRHDVVCLNLNDPAEEKLPHHGLFLFQDQETGHVLEIDLSSKKNRDAYAEIHQKRKNDWIYSMRQSGIDHLVLTTDTDYIKALVKLFHQREARFK
ncbi:DUF58 domain-containing protein [bacterium]|nr:DUF58 domain-containing protein [bacterium]